MSDEIALSFLFENISANTRRHFTQRAHIYKKIQSEFRPNHISWQKIKPPHQNGTLTRIQRRCLIDIKPKTHRRYIGFGESLSPAKSIFIEPISGRHKGESWGNQRTVGWQSSPAVSWLSRRILPIWHTAALLSRSSCGMCLRPRKMYTVRRRDPIWDLIDGFSLRVVWISIMLSNDIFRLNVEQSIVKPFKIIFIPLKIWLNIV